MYEDTATSAYFNVKIRMRLSMLYDIIGSVQPIPVKAFFLMARAESQWVIISSVIRIYFESYYR